MQKTQQSLKSNPVLESAPSIQPNHTQSLIHPQAKSAQNQQQYYPPTTQPYQYRIFIAECNGYVGSQLVEHFRNDDEIQVNPNILCGTLKEGEKTIGENGVDSIINIQDRRTLNCILLQSDIIVYQLNKNNYHHFEYILKFLRQSKHEGSRPQRLICISSLLTWNSKRQKLDTTPSLQNLVNRNSTQTNLMFLQNLCLQTNTLNLNIEASVVCAGILYGCGEGQLFKYFKKALEQSESLKVYGTGSNHIPMVHIKDLITIVKDIAFTGQVGNVKRGKDNLGYFFAVDSAKATQKEIVKCIAESLGNGQIEELCIQDAFLQRNFDQMTQDLQVRDLPTLENWHAVGGFVQNISNVISEFNLYRGLRPNKILILGAPASGKSRIAQFLQKSYGLPVLTIKNVLDQLLSQDDQFATQIKTKLQQIRAIKYEEEKKLFEQAKKKKKGKKDANEQFVPSTPRLPQDQLIRVFRNRLSQADCLNKGYILDGWPKSSKSTQSLFTSQNGEIDEQKLPNSCFNLNATQQQVKQRLKTIPQQLKDGTHWTDDGNTRRFQIHNKNIEDGGPISFLNGKVDIKNVPINYDGTQQFVDFVERNGPLGFKKQEQPVEVQQNQQDIHPSQQQIQQNAQNDEEAEQQQNQYQEQPQNSQFDIQKLTQHEKQILNEKSRPIRQYLIDNVIPDITEGLLQICKDNPNDPIDFLIRFLQLKQSQKNNK